MTLEPEIETRPWAEQVAIDDAAYREQIAYLLRALALLPRQAGRGGVRLGGARPAASATSPGCR